MASAGASRAVKFYGTEAVEPKTRIVRTGAISVVLDNGALRYIRLNDVEILRAIAFLVRDENWGTFTPQISNLKIMQNRAGFNISYDARCGDARRELLYRAEITCSPEGRLKFAVTATPSTDFLTNRTGFVVLHPLKGVVGKAVAIEHADGTKSKDKFPQIINPVQPFYSIRAMTHSPLPGIKAEVRFEGDVFETEDHRNWTDASFKTYVRPLALPWPYVLAKGETFVQSVTLTLGGKLPKAKAQGGAKPVVIAIGKQASVMPAIGASVPMSEAEAASERAGAVKAAGLKNLICQIDGRKAGLAVALKNYKSLAEATGADVALEIILPAKASPAAELAPVADAVKASGLKVSAIAVSPAPDLKAVLPGSKGGGGASFEEIYAAARAAFPGAKLGGGMFSFFTELNRKPPPAALLDFITHTTCPIVHAADDISVMETLEALPYVTASARAITKGKPYHIGPTSIPARDNPYGASVASNTGNGRVCLADMDPRQRGLFGAAWTLGLISAFAEGGAAAIALGAVTGPQGMIYRPGNYSQPHFDGRESGVYPLFHVVSGMAQAQGAKRLATKSADPSIIAAVAYKGKSGSVLWLANLTSMPRKAKIEGFPGKVIQHTIDATSFGKATRDSAFLTKGGKAIKKVGSVELGPYAVVRLAAG